MIENIFFFRGGLWCAVTTRWLAFASNDIYLITGRYAKTQQTVTLNQNDNNRWPNSIHKSMKRQKTLNGPLWYVLDSGLIWKEMLYN